MQMEYGKRYSWGPNGSEDKNAKVPPNAYFRNFGPGDSWHWATCGREHAWLGTEGFLWVYDQFDTHIFKLWWNVPASEDSKTEVRAFDVLWNMRVDVPKVGGPHVNIDSCQKCLEACVERREIILFLMIIRPRLVRRLLHIGASSGRSCNCIYVEWSS